MIKIFWLLYEHAKNVLLFMCKNNISHNDIHNFIMIFMHDVYKFIPTYRLTLSGYPTRETINQIGVALQATTYTQTCNVAISSYYRGSDSW